MTDDDKVRLSRRSAMVGATASAIALPSAVRSAARSGPAKPNIVFILADDLGYADVSFNGQPDFKTPNIDRISVDGARLSRAYANSAVCSATRTALMTGRYQYRLPVGLEEPLAMPRPGLPGLPPEVPTLPSLLRGQGYQTALVGKWHLGLPPVYGPLKSGYDHFFGFRGGALDYFTHDLLGRPDLWDDDAPAQKNGYLTELIGDRAAAMIGMFSGAARPFFLSVHFNAPHWPWEGPIDRAESARTKAEPQDFDGGSKRTYAAMVGALDDQVGVILRALRRSGVADNTIVVFTSDNGGERYADVWPFSGQKTELLEGGLRVPAAVAWPGRIARGSVCRQAMITMDWVPTLLAAAGTQLPADAPSDGLNLLPTLTNAAPPVPRRLFWRYKANHQRAMLDGDFKYLKIAGNSFLFEVEADPLERANLKDRDPQRFAAMAAAWTAWNHMMLPEIDASFTDAVTADKQASHIGSNSIISTADPDD